MNIVGWGKIVPQLAAFFAILKRRPNSLTPFNLFLSGKPGTNKTEGIVHLATLLGHLVPTPVDCATLDDVSELAGVIDLKANRDSGEARIIAGDLLQQPLLILDEFLNTRPHVLPQFRLFLQGQLVLFGKKLPVNFRAIIGTGNLADEMQQGDANMLDSPTADRFAMVVRTPCLSEMTAAEVESILEGRGSDEFAIAFRQAVDNIDSRFEQVEAACGAQVTKYIQCLVAKLAGTPFAFEGRRGKLLRLFVLAALALHEAEPVRDRKETVWAIVQDCLSYHRLSGMVLDMSILQSAHEAAYGCIGAADIEQLIAAEPELSGKIRLLVQHRQRLSPMTKAAVFGLVFDSSDHALQLACLELLQSATMADEPSELVAFLQRIPFPDMTEGVRLDDLARISAMSETEALIFQIAKGDAHAMERLGGRVREYLMLWEINQATS